MKEKYVMLAGVKIIIENKKKRVVRINSFLYKLLIESFFTRMGVILPKPKGHIIQRIKKLNQIGGKNDRKTKRR